MDVGSPGAEEVPLPLTQASIGRLHSEGALPLRIGGHRFAANCIPGTAGKITSGSFLGLARDPHFVASAMSESFCVLAWIWLMAPDFPSISY